MSTYTEDELSSMTRADLDVIAEEEGLDPADYSNKSDEVTAILALQGNGELATVEPAESPGFAGLDVSTLDPEKKPGPPVLGPDEHFLLTGESWVRLGVDPSVPDWAVGMPASVSSFPVAWEKDANGDNLYPYTDPGAIITVRERSQGATFDIPLSSVERLVIAGGRSVIVNHS